MKRSLNKIIPGILLAIFLTACQTDLLDTSPKDKLNSDIFWKSQDDAINAVNSIYSLLPGIADVRWDMLSDIGHGNSGTGEQPVLERGEHDANTGRFLNLWRDQYKMIRAVNYFLENVDAVKEYEPDMPEELLVRLKAEARFMRAFAYTRLVTLFGNVPLVLKTMEVSEAQNVAQADKEEIWDFIEQELSAIAADLPVEYPAMDVGRVTRGAALAMNARAMLYAGRWDKAAAAAKSVIDLNNYSLYPSYKDLFSYTAENNEEVIFDRQYAKDVASHNFFGAYAPRGMNGLVGIAPTRTLIDAYETTNGLPVTADPAYDPYHPYANRDPRLDHTLFVPSFSDDVPGEELYNGKIYDPRPGSGTGDEVGVDYQRSKTGFNMQKYINPEDMQDRSNCGTNFIMIRYADVLLMYAEARIESGQIDQSVYDAINEVRQRPDVNMPPVAAGKSQDQLRQIVRHERLVELALEGLRFFDLRRWGIAHEVMQGAIPGLRYIAPGGSEIKELDYRGVIRHFTAPRDYLFPIPQQEMVLNTNLVQNKGY